MATSKALLLLAILGCACSVLAARELSDAAMVERHERWMVEYGRVYKDAAEKARRFEVFKDNVGAPLTGFQRAGCLPSMPL